MPSRRPFASRGYARRRSPYAGDSLRLPTGALALLAVVALIGGVAFWARDKLPVAVGPLDAQRPPAARLVLATSTPAPAEVGKPMQELNLAQTVPTAPSTATPTKAPTPMPTLRQWDAAADGIDIDPVLVGQLDQALMGIEGTVSIAVKDLGSGRGAVLDGSREMEAASLFKLTVMYAVFDAGLSFGEPLPVTDQALSFDAGTMELASNAGETLSVAESLERMVTISDNASAIMLGSRVGAGRITRDIAALGMDTTHYSLERMTTSALDMVALLEPVARGDAVSPNASAEMVHLLLRQRVNDRLPRLLPNDARVAHKTGNLPGVVNDVGIIYGPTSTVAVAALVSDTSNEAAAAAAIARVALVAHTYFEALPTDPTRPRIPPQPQRAVPPTWREPKPTMTPAPTPEPEPEPTATPQPTVAPPTLVPAAVISAPTARPNQPATTPTVPATTAATRAPTTAPAATPSPTQRR
ncbi:MAG TPA: serine hydrolase [Chloroflexota bacterium]